MGIQVADGFSLKSKKPLDERLQFATVALMVATSENNLYDGCEAYVIATKKYYSYDSTNEVDETLGKWRERQSGGSGGTSDYEDLENKPSINGVELSGNKTASDLDLDKAVELTEAEYSELSEEEKMNGTTYFLTDGEGGGDFSIKKRVLNAGATTVSLSCPTTGDYITRIYTSDGRDYLGTSVSEGILTITFEAPSTNVDVFVEFRGV